MKPPILFFLLLLANSTTATYTPEALDYVLRCIEYEASVAGGTLSLVMYDLAPKFPFDNILSAIVQSPRLEHVVKYMVNGSYRENLVNLPWHPSMLLIHPGYDVAHLMRSSNDIKAVLKLFNPTTKVLVFVDFNNLNLLVTVFGKVFNVGFVSMVFFDSVAMRADLWNRVSGMRWKRVPPPMYLFTWMRREMTGVNITYYDESLWIYEWNWNVLWIKEVARYLKTDASQYDTYCDQLTGKKLQKCLVKQQDHLDNIDLKIEEMVMRPDTSREFAALTTGIPRNIRIAIPRDRPLNVAELMVMPFSWNVWMLLIAILVVAELMKQLFPDLFKNDPTLLAVCGYERHNLHEAGQIEKLTFLSLIVLMFFASNAFETKMLSMMVSKPAIQRIKTSTDLLESDIKFYADVEACPNIFNQTIFGALTVQGSINVFDTIPGVGLIASDEVADILDLTAFDYERMEPWYVLLDIRYHSTYEIYQTRWRYENVEIFRYIYGLLFETGIISFWKSQYRIYYQAMSIGKRIRVSIDSKVDLNFDDMQPAWVALGIGLGVSFLLFLSEIVQNRLKSELVFKGPGNFPERKRTVVILDFE